MATLTQVLEERNAESAIAGRLREAADIARGLRLHAMTPEALQDALAEVDPRLVDLIYRQQGWSRVGASEAELFTEEERLAKVNESRWMYRYDPQTWRSVNLWTDFGFGQQVKITPKDEALAEVFKAFLEAPANGYILNPRKMADVLSNKLITGGEHFLVFFASTVDGACTLRRLTTSQIRTIVYDKDDSDVPLWYLRDTADGTIAYPDWRATPEQLENTPPPDKAKPIADVLSGQERATVAVILHVAVDEENGRGWPLIARALAWFRAYKEFLENRASVAAAIATYVDKVKVQGGSRAADAMVTRLESALTRLSAGGETNPPPAAGGTWVENAMVDRQRLSLGTGAGDAQTDGMTIASQGATGAGVPIHFLNRPDTMQNKSVARESGLPWYEQIQRYQTLWVSVFQDMVNIVARFATEYGGKSFADTTADVTLDSPFDADITELVSALGAVGSAAQAGTLLDGPAERVTSKLTMLLLTAFGIRGADEIVAVTDDDLQREDDNKAMAKAIAQPKDTGAEPDADAVPDTAQDATENYLRGDISLATLTDYLSGLREHEAA